MIITVESKKVRIDCQKIDYPQKRVESDLKKYLKGEKVSFGYKIDFSEMTKFQRAVFSQMRKVPYGKTITYGELAKKSGYPRAARAVGSVCKSNQTPLVVPCHRVVSKTGIGGYSLGISLKRKLLKMEGVL